MTAHGDTADLNIILTPASDCGFVVNIEFKY